MRYSELLTKKSRKINGNVKKTKNKFYFHFQIPKVDLSLDFDVIQIGKRVELTVKSEPKSVCAISAMDKSVSFMGARNSIKIDKVLNN